MILMFLIRCINTKKMCIGCLRNQIECFENTKIEMEKELENISCECCKSYPRFLLSMNEDLKVLALTKIKKIIPVSSVNPFNSVDLSQKIS